MTDPHLSTTSSDRPPPVSASHLDHGQWITLKAAVCITRRNPDALRTALKRINTRLGGAVLRRFGPRGHWWVNVSALAELIETSGKLTESVDALSARQDEMEDRLNSLRDSQRDTKRRLRRLEGQQTEQTAHPSPHLYRGPTAPGSPR